MDSQIMSQMAANLVEATARNGASIISSKIKAAKLKKNIKRQLVSLRRLYMIC